MNPMLEAAVFGFLKERELSLDDAEIERLPGDGSRRVFWRIALPAYAISFIAMSNPPDTPALGVENHAYLKIGRHLYRKGIPVPDIYAYHLTSGWFIMEDLGRMTLQDAAALENDPLPLYTRVLTYLFQMQTEGAVDFDPVWCWQTGRYDRTVMMRYEADYFRDAFLVRYLGLPAEGLGLDPAFGHLAETASEAPSDFFLHRDFQSRNIMVSEGRIGFVDWQGGRLGPLGYDLASLIIDPYTLLSPGQRQAVYARYLEQVEGHNPAWVVAFEHSYPYLAIQRNLQILGAFSHLTQAMGKAHFEAYIPGALDTLHGLLREVPDRPLLRLRNLVDELRSHQKILDIAR